MEDRIIIIGAGGFGRHVLSILRSLPKWNESQFLGFLDDGEVSHERLQKVSAPHLGPTALLDQLPKGTQYIIGIGNGRVREKLNTVATKAGLKPMTVIHPDTSIVSDATIGEGAVICAGVRITTNVKIKRQVHLNMNVTVGHDAELDDFATVYPLVAIGGESHLGQRATIGAGTVINPGISIGPDSYVASGAAVVRNVEPATLVAGVPAFKKRGLI